MIIPPKFLHPPGEEISRQYKENISQVYETLTELVLFSNSLGGKVDSLLHKQEEEFFRAYKSHLTTIKDNVAQLEHKISFQEHKIKEYESEGTIALLLKKISGLETEINNLYAMRTKLTSGEEVSNTEIQEQKVRNGVVDTENTKLGESIKQLIKDKARDHIKLSETKDIINEMAGERERERRDEPSRLFPTEVRRESLVNKSLKDVSFKQEGLSVSVDVEKKMLRNRISSLTTKNHKLLKNTIEVGLLHSQLEGFFLECVQTVKKDICLRKQVPLARLSDFRREDKTNLLSLVLQNDEIIASIYSRLFRNPPSKSTKPLESAHGESLERESSLVESPQRIESKSKVRVKIRHSQSKVLEYKKQWNVLLPEIKHKSLRIKEEDIDLN